jgi:HSP20 family molecular chaperone IbpA
MFLDLRRDIDRIFDIPILNISDPFEEMLEMRNRMIDAFDNHLPQLKEGEKEETKIEKKKDKSSGEITRRTGRWYPRCDINENDKEYIISAEVPGMKKEEVKIEYDNNKHILSISGEVYLIN